MYKYCSHCGYQAEAEANFCTRCGTRIGDTKFNFEEKEEIPNNPEDMRQSGKKENKTHFYSNSTAQLFRDSFSPEAIQKISTACKVYNIEIVTSDVEEIKVSWEKTDSWSLTPQIIGDTLHLKERYRLGMHNIHDFFHNSGHNIISVELPKSKKFDLSLENETGSISVSDVEVRNQAELRTSIGKIEIHNLKVPENLFVSTGTGSISTSLIEAGQGVRLSSQIGKIRADHIKAGTFYANSTGGRCSFSDILTTDQFAVTGGVGELLLDHITAGKMDVRMNASGSVNCQNLYSDTAISIYNTVGNITCGISDDAANYTTHCHSDQGEKNLPEVSGKGNKTLNVRTSVGSVNIYFTGVKK